MASVVHDKMYSLIKKASPNLSVRDRMLRRSEADDVFLIGMQIQQDSWNPRSLAAWLSVRVFGWLVRVRYHIGNLVKTFFATRTQVKCV